MRLVQIELKNFRQYLEASVEFPSGVTGIIGPNGAGKTTILEAIAWALYGAPAVRESNDTVRSAAADGGSSVQVTLTFEINNVLYTVSRVLQPPKRSHAGGRVTADALLEMGGTPIVRGMSDVSEAIARLLGMDYRAFFTSFFTAQKELEFMSQLDGRARAVMIGRMLGYERLTKARDKANEDRKGLAREVEGLEQGLADPEELKARKHQAEEAAGILGAAVQTAEAALKTAQSEAERLKPLKEASEQKAKRFAEIDRRIELDRAEAARGDERVGQLEKQLADLDAKRKELDGMQPDLVRYQQAGEEYKKLRALQEHEGERQRLAGQIASAESELKKLESRLKQLSGARDKQTRAAIALGEGDEQLKKLDQSIQSAREQRVSDERGCQARIEQIEAQLRQIQEKKTRIAEAGAEGVCPTCERPLAGELPKVLTHFDEEAAGLNVSLNEQKLALKQIVEGSVEVEKLSANREKLSAEVERLRAEKSAADTLATELAKGHQELATRKTELDPLRAQVDNLPKGFDPERFKELHRTGEELRPKWDRSIELKSDLKREPEMRAELDGLATALAVKKNEISQNESTLKELDFRPNDHDELMRQYDRAAEALNTAGIETERRRGELAKSSATLDAVKQEEKRYRDRLELLSKKRSERLHLQVLAETFDKLRIELNDQIRPELEAIASDLLAAMTDGRYNVLEIDDNYEARIRDDGELKPVISGGEEDIVNLALRLAISQMIADRAGQSFSLLVLDEVFGSLDDVRRDSVVALLQNLKNRFEQIILITHVESIHDAVDNCLWVQFDERTKTSRLIEQSVDSEPSTVGAVLSTESEPAIS